MKIYLATPYSDPDPKVREQRFKTICRVAGDLMKQGHIVFSSISHSHPIAVECDLPKGFYFWSSQDVPFLHWCDEVFVYENDGWNDSIGVLNETRIAMQLNKPIRYIKKDEKYHD